MSQVKLRFSSVLTPSDPNQHPVLIVGQLKNLHRVSYDVLKTKLEPRVTEETYNAALSSLHPSPTDSCSLWLMHATVAALPTKCSRHNTPSRAHSLTKIVRSCMSGGDEYIVVVCEKSHVLASACAIARALPLYTRKSSAGAGRRTVTAEFLLVPNTGVAPLQLNGLSLEETELQCLRDIAEGIRLAARITDTPCKDMHTDTFIREIRNVGETLGLDAVVIRGEELKSRGFGGLYAVGKAAIHLPALVILSHTPEGATKNIAWVGKGIVYDTGGLSIKGKTTMPGMKRDCGGAAAVLGAFYAIVKQGFSENLHAVFCLAENAVGPNAVRPDDIITLYSGRTVEVNNTDAEGRLVLGDGVAYAAKDLKADVIIDLATLTGAQGLATGRYHAALLTNTEEWEDNCMRAGRLSGDLVHPLVYCPELHFSEFASAVADMKNSSADRSNGEVSCAGLFIASHIGFDFPGVWVHIDLAYPVYSGERATGYGVGLLVALFGETSTSQLLQSSATVTNHLVDELQDKNGSKKIRLS